MCLAIYKPKGIIIPESHLRNAFEVNDDGAGFAVRTRKSVKIIKGFMSYEHFARAFKQYERAECIIHFRLATAGSAVPINTHPFRIGKYAMIHNGCISIKPDGDKTDSETFGLLVLEPLLEKSGINDPSLSYLINTAIGNDKLVFLGPEGHCIIGEDRGRWVDGVWYSNGTYRTPYYTSGFGLFDGSRGIYPSNQKIGYPESAFMTTTDAEERGSEGAWKDELTFEIERLRDLIRTETSEYKIARLVTEIEDLHEQLAYFNTHD